MCSVDLLQIRLDGKPYQYAREYKDEETLLAKTTTSPTRTLWQAIQSLYTFPHLDDKENREGPSTVASLPLCVEIVVIFNVRAQDDSRSVHTLWKLSSGSFYHPTSQTQTQFHEETLWNEHGWFFNTYPFLTADDALEIRTIAPPSPAVFHDMHRRLRAI